MASIPYGYLLPALLVLWCQGAVWLPRTWARVRPPFGLPFTVNELPGFALVIFLGPTWLAFSTGDIDSIAEWCAFGLTIVASLGLIGQIYFGLQASSTIHRALDRGFGKTDWRTSIPPRMALQLGRSFTPIALLGPFLIRRHDVRRIANIPYGNAGLRNLLDIYQPRSLPTSAPVLVHLHGGAFVRGKKNREGLPLLYRLASKGFLGISANYRLRPSATFPDQLIDIKKVIAWIREYGQEYGADPSQIFIAGSSAGANLAALAALTPNDPSLQPGFEEVDTAVDAAICLYGYYGSVDLHAGVPSSPLAYTNPEAPPFFLAHGDRDTIVPVEEARHFQAHLRHASSQPVIYAELPGAEHVFDLFHSIRNEAILHGIEAFTAWVRANNGNNFPR
ncbi:alpha/beta hydrolase [Thalassobacillus pellis]|uniref:alpha/beta hydrolase n=1 Tax=Thalassobacillus pellis TaxID=748008 RepID=UPI0019603F8E|nr:alpha/beta hydrolase [Thalassobacillus pellis]MBM7551247.1 acetyl esterase/lipase [Thalassobacillus pellis]